MRKNRQEILWVDIAKIVAWGGVLLQHIYGYLYTNRYIYLSSWYAVMLFVFIGGFLQALSYEKRGVLNIRKKIVELIFSYVVATAIYVFCSNHNLDLETYISHIIHFDASGPFYYIWVYLQLLILSPLLIGGIKWADQNKKINVFRNVLVLLVVFAVCYFNVNYTGAFNLCCSGGHIGGGIWLVFWYGGMRLKDFLSHEIKRPKTVFIIGVLLLICWGYFFIAHDKMFLIGPILRDTQVNGLNWFHGIQMFLIVLVVKTGTQIISGNVHMMKVLIPLAFLGRNTLYLFLYHMLFLNFGSFIYWDNIWMRRVFIIVIMFLGPLSIQWVVETVSEWIKHNLLDKINVC